MVRFDNPWDSPATGRIYTEKRENDSYINQLPRESYIRNPVEDYFADKNIVSYKRKVGGGWDLVSTRENGKERSYFVRYNPAYGSVQVVKKTDKRRKAETDIRGDIVPKKGFTWVVDTRESPGR